MSVRAAVPRFVGSCRLSQALQRPSPMRPLRPICPIFQLSIPRHFLSIQSILSIALTLPRNRRFCPFWSVFARFSSFFSPHSGVPNVRVSPCSSVFVRVAVSPRQRRRNSAPPRASPRYGVPLGTPPHSTPSRHFPPPPFPQFPHFPLVFRPFFAKNPLKTPQKPQKTPKKP
jgi:hypothetical protein